MRLIAYLISLIFIGILIAATTMAYTTLLLNGERSGFQQAATVLDTGIVADYVATEVMAFSDGTLSGNSPIINTVYMVSARDEDGNGLIDFEDRVSEINSGMFNIDSSDITIKLNDPDKTSISSISQSIKYSASTTKKWEEERTGILWFRQISLDNLLARIGLNSNSLVGTFSTCFSAIEWLWDYFTSSGQDAVIGLESLSGVTYGLPFSSTPAVIKNANIVYTIPVVISEANTTIYDSTSAQLQVLKLDSFITFYDVKEYISAVSTEWEN